MRGEINKLKILVKLVEIFPKYFKVVKVEDFIIEDEFQVLIIHFNVLGQCLCKTVRGNNEDWSESFKSYMKSLGAKIANSQKFQTRKQFELCAANVPSLLVLNFDWDSMRL